MIIIAGRAAKPPLPFGSFYPRDCSILGFAMFNASADEQSAWPPPRSPSWPRLGLLKTPIGKTFPLARGRRGPQVPRWKPPSTGSGGLMGKVVIIEID